MRKAALIVFILLALICAGALALTGSGYPAWDGQSAPTNGLNTNLDGEKIALNFDPTPGYSAWSDDRIQACFFAYDKGERNYLELYLLLPGKISAGDVYTCDDDSSASVTLYEVSRDAEALYYTGKVKGSAYPEGSRFEIHIETVEMEPARLYVQGHLEARLGGIEADSPNGAFLELNDSHFAFSLPQGNLSPSSVPSMPASSPAPALSQAPSGAMPVFTLPPDYRVI